MNSETEKQLNCLLASFRAEDKVCPKPDFWNHLWEMLPGRRQGSTGWEPPLPMILGVWWIATAEQKTERFSLHLRYAADKGVLDEVEEYLNSLAVENWAYGSGT